VTRVAHPRPNPIIAALYALRDLDVDVAVIHGPAGCGFMASRMLEMAGMRVVTSSMSENDLIFGAEEPLIETLRAAEGMFSPRTMAVVGTCASMIIGERLESSIQQAGLSCRAFAVDCHGCMGDNTAGAVRTVKAAAAAGMITDEEAARQRGLLEAATALERRAGMASKPYLRPAAGPTKNAVCRLIARTLADGGKVAVVMLAKKELAYRFADMLRAVDEARRALGGRTLLVANLDASRGLPRIRGYARDIMGQLGSEGVAIDRVLGALDEYAVCGGAAAEAVSGFDPDLTVVAGIPHAYPCLAKGDALVTDQPRQLSNYLSNGFANSVCEMSSHALVMNARSIVPLETAETLREIVQEMVRARPSRPTGERDAAPGASPP